MNKLYDKLKSLFFPKSRNETEVHQSTYTEQTITIPDSVFDDDCADDDVMLGNDYDN